MHEVRITKKEPGLSSSGDVNPQQEYNKTLAPKDIVSQESDTVNSKFSNRIDDSMSNRSLLANALESVAASPMEKQKLAEYKAMIREMNVQSRKLQY